MDADRIVRIIGCLLTGCHIIYFVLDLDRINLYVTYLEGYGCRVTCSYGEAGLSRLREEGQVATRGKRHLSQGTRVV